MNLELHHLRRKSSETAAPPRSDLLSCWLTAAAGVFTTDDLEVTGWQDGSGAGHNAQQPSSGNRPVLIETALNGKNVIRFDGEDDYLTSSSAGVMRAAYIVFRISSTQQMSNELGSLFGEYTKGHIAPDPRASSNVRGFSFDGNAGVSASYNLDGAAYVSANTNSNAQQWSYDTFHLVSAVFTSDVSLSDYKIGTLGGHFSVGQHQYGGDIAEIIVYSAELSAEEEEELEDYITSVWGI